MSNDKTQQWQYPKTPFQFIGMGFQHLTTRPYLLILPLLLDLFLWLGPRLSFTKIFDFTDPEYQKQFSLFLAEDDLDLFSTSIENANGFWGLTQPAIGIPSAISNKLLSETIYNNTIWYFESSVDTILGILGLVFIGILMGAGYFYLLGKSITKETEFPSAELGFVVLNFIGIFIAFIVGFLVLFIPTVLFLVIMQALQFSFLGIFLLTFLFFWAMLYLSFTVHGIVLGRLPLHKAMKQSFIFVKTYRQIAIPLMLFVTFGKILLTQFVWIPLITGNWMTALNIIAHAYIAVAFGLATFFLYQPYAFKLQHINQS